MKHVIVLGAGGLGCPVLLSLAAWGERVRVTLVDDDRVEASNLHRQVLYADGVRGQLKVDAAAHRLQQLNPNMVVNPICERILPEDVSGLLSESAPCDGVLDCTDQAELKFAVNDACVASGIPAVIGGVIGGQGQALAIAGGSACYRCIFEEPPPAGVAARCGEVGVLGTAPGVLGAWMAALCHRLLTGDRTCAGRLWRIDLWTMQIRTLSSRRREGCAACAHLSLT